jgi:hypothetical protein
MSSKTSAWPSDFYPHHKIYFFDLSARVFVSSICWLTVSLNFAFARHVSSGSKPKGDSQPKLHAGSFGEALALDLGAD